MKSIETIAIALGGGPTPVIKDQVAGALFEIQQHGLKAAGFRSGLEGFLHADANNVLDITHWDPIEIRASGPGADPLHTTRLKLKKGENTEEVATIRRNKERYNIDSMIKIGGNDSALTLAALEFGVHASKTVDNDLPYAHHTSGFGSAALFNAIMIRNLVRDIGSSRVVYINGATLSYLTAPVTIYQTMGRDTGWLSLATGFARVDPHGIMNPKLPPDIIWPREIPFDEDVFLSALSDVLSRKGKAFVVIGEELAYKDGRILAEVQRAREQDLNRRLWNALEEQPGGPELYHEFLGLYGIKESRDPHGHVEHARSGAFSYADFLAKLAKRELKLPSVDSIKETPLVPNHLQRAAYVKSETDAREAFEVGREAVRAILDRQEQVSIVIKSNGRILLDRVPISYLAGKTRHVPLEYIEGIRGPTQAFVDEFLPTIGGEGALPHYSKLDFSRVIRPGH